MTNTVQNKTEKKSQHAYLQFRKSYLCKTFEGEGRIKELGDIFSKYLSVKHTHKDI